ncbi:MAG: acyl-ACP--UDP-N-acetylglucosamine O-acyltransferase [Chthoniobacterales bacterium]|nr:acyl-ACP--UDP-N-acetylglucosamine O-acyltransferase [Chthoniobacterales bacterium]
MSIHPSAIVDPAAQIAADVAIGPYAVIGSGARIDGGCVLLSHVIMEGDVQLGANNLVGHGAILGAPPQDIGFLSEMRSGVTIGQNNRIREYCTIHRGAIAESRTVIGDDNFLMAGAHVGHNCVITDGVIIANNCLLGGHVRIDERAFIGGATTLHQNMHVGRLVMAQGSSAFGKDIPPFLLAAERNYVFGVNQIGLKRAGFSSSDRDEIKRAFKLLYRSGLNTRQALEAAGQTDFGPLGREFFAFVANAKKRGILAYRYGAERTE